MAFFQAQNLRVEKHDGGVAILALDVPGKALNVFTRSVFTDLDQALARVAEDASLRLLIIRSAKAAGFLAGADLHEFQKITSADDARQLAQTGQQLFDKVAALRLPVVALIHGPCLGGGLELALACDYRIAVDIPTTQFGLPEIELGLLPAWGGTQRLPRVIGLERGLQVILGGRRLNAAAAETWGLVDRLVPPLEIPPKVACTLAESVAWRGKHSRSKLPLRTWRQWGLESHAFGRRLIFKGAERILTRRVPDDMPAPREALEAVRTGIAEGVPAGLARERDAAARLVATPPCRNLINLFFAREQARKLPESVRDAGRKVRKVGIVGAGTMGAGIAQLAAIRGFEVVVHEASEAALASATLKIVALFEKAVGSRVLTREDADKRIAAIKTTIGWDGFGDVDLVVEAVIEDLDTKRAVFHELEQHVRHNTVLATNTSSLTVRSLQEGLAHPRRVAGLHFFNPVHKLPLVEVARSPVTDDRTVSLLQAWTVAIGKTALVVRDSPGFVVNRVLVPYFSEAVLLVAEGMAPDRIDQTMIRFGMPAGPLEVLDQVGLDVAAHIVTAMQPVIGDRLPPQSGFAKLVERGWLGQKSRAGFYRDHGSAKPKVHREAVALLQAERPAGGGLALASLPATVQAQQARERMVLSMVNEAARCVAEKLAENAEAIDLAMVLGTGWAPHRGGPLRYARDRGIDNVIQALTDLAARLGPRFEPCGELPRWASGR